MNGNFLSLVKVEFQKIRRCGIIWILLAAVVILWIPSILNANMNFGMQAEGISPEHNFLIQGFMAMAWFMFPASMVVGTVLLTQTERSNHGILKMLALPLHDPALPGKIHGAVDPGRDTDAAEHRHVLCQRRHRQPYPGLPFYIALCIRIEEAGLMFLAGIPMLAFFWLLSICIQTPVFSVGMGLASIVPSVLIINTRYWFAYPMSYPFFVIVAEYGKLATVLETAQVELFPWIPVAVGITVLCLTASCLCFGRAERK